MNPSLIKKLCCPIDKSDLHMKIFAENEDGEIAEGMLTCSECKRYYPIVYGIPIMTPDEYREQALEKPMLEKWGLTLENTKGKFLLKEA